MGFPAQYIIFFRQYYHVTNYPTKTIFVMIIISLWS